MDINATPASLIYQNLKKDFEKGISEAKPVSGILTEKVKSTSNSNVYGWLGHIPNMRRWYAGQPRVLRNVETFDYEVTNRKYEGTIQIPKDDVDDNQLSSYSTVAKQQGVLGTLLEDELVFELFNNAFGTTLTYDGLSWCNDAHVVGLSTVDNALGALALSDTNLKVAITKLRSFTVQADKLSSSRPLNPGGEKLVLVCNPALEWTAKDIVAVKTVSTGGENSLYQACEVLATSWITDTNNWFVVNVGGSIKPVFVQDREALSFRNLTPQDSDQGFMLDEYIYGTKRRLATLPTVPWMVVGSTGS